MGRDSDGAGDLLAPVEVHKKMLAEALASHGRNSVAAGGCSGLRVVPHKSKRYVMPWS
jgi:hypothetical protein